MHNQQLRMRKCVAVFHLLVKSPAFVRASIFRFSYKFPLEKLNGAKTHTGAGSNLQSLMGNPNPAAPSHESVNCCVVSFSKTQ